ncbi:unnamed protein product [Caenorhabditis nigoni]
MNQTGPKQHNDTEFQFYQRKEGESLTISTALLELARCDELDATMFYMDLSDTGNNSTAIVENLKCLDRFVENIKPDKKFYLRQLPILLSMTDKEPHFFLEEVVEIASLLLRRSPNSHKELPEKTVLDSSSDDIVPKVITLSEVKTLFEDCDIDKGLVTITPDIEYSTDSNRSLQYNQQLQGAAKVLIQKEDATTPQ